MMNYYTLEVYKKQNQPIFVITIKHELLAGVYFFETLENANTFINETKKSIEYFTPLYYNENGTTDENYIKVIKLVLSCDNIKIGKNGKTYYIDNARKGA